VKVRHQAKKATGNKLSDTNTGKQKKKNSDGSKTTSQKPSTSTTPSKQTNKLDTISENVVKIHNHCTKPGDPLFFKTVCTKYLLNLPTKQSFNYKMQVTTLQFIDKKQAINLIEKVPVSEFEVKASYELYKQNKTSQAPRCIGPGE
jgi:hypothetical protein